MVRRLARDADVVVENFRPGVAGLLGIGFEELSAGNRGLVYCSISGYGPSSAAAGRPALDIVLQAVTGVMDRQGRGGPPQMLVVTLADTYAASLAVQSVLAALLHRGRAGAGQHVEVTLYEALIAAQGYRIVTPAGQAMLPAVDDVVPYQAFQASDGQWLVIAVVSDGNWRALCGALGRAHLAADPAFGDNALRVKNKTRLIPPLETAFATRSRAEWLEILQRHGVPAGPVLASRTCSTTRIWKPAAPSPGSATPPLARCAAWAARCTCQNLRSSSAAPRHCWASTPVRCCWAAATPMPNSSPWPLAERSETRDSRAGPPVQREEMAMNRMSFEYPAPMAFLARTPLVQARRAAACRWCSLRLPTHGDLTDLACLR